MSRDAARGPASRRPAAARRALARLLTGLLLAGLPGLARAQSDLPSVTPRDPTPVPGAASTSPARITPFAGMGVGGPTQDTNAPVTFTADEVEYDREKGLVTARGKVEAWQGERLLRADEFTYDRNTGIATARGNVQLLEPDGSVLFAEEAELKDRFRDGVLEGVRGLLAANGKLAANGARRTGGTINEFSRVVYSACDLCKDDPTAPPLWQVEAKRATQDKEALRISYRDATVRMYGWPVLYTPYLSHPDPSAPRASGFLFPTFGITRFLGGFFQTPYFWVLDDSSDLLITPVFSTKQYPNLGLEYRKLFNFGEIIGSASVGGLKAEDNNGKAEPAGHIFLKGRFTVDENWRAGFDLNRATNEIYLRTFRYDYRRVLTSQVYTEGFWGTEGYARLDARAYQGLRTLDDTRQVPYVLPNIYGEVAPREKVFGGNLNLNAGILGIYRDIGSQSQRVATQARWERPEIGSFGDLWTFKMQGDALGYHAQGQELAPIYLPDANGTRAVGNFRAAIDWRMPFVRDAGEYGSQTIEPHMQFVTGPRTSAQRAVPNEDSVDFEFTDANLFALNRFNGRDRQEGGSRVDAAMRGAWDFPNGGQIEGLVGRSLRLDDDFRSENPYAGSGLDRRASDYVARLRVAPVSWFETIGRVRTDGERMFERKMADATANLTIGQYTVSAGYLYSVPLPYLIPPASRDEVSVGLNGKVNEYWRFGVGAKYDLALGRPVLGQGIVTYEDECFILEGRFIKRFARDPATDALYPANTVVLFRIGFKTLGEYYFRAI